MELGNPSYKKWLEEIKCKIKTAQLKVAVSANAQLIELYWQLAQEIINRQKKTEWGESIIDQLSLDLRLSFPDIKGFSRRNLYAIRQWYLFYSLVSPRGCLKIKFESTFFIFSNSLSCYLKI